MPLKKKKKIKVKKKITKKVTKKTKVNKKIITKAVKENSKELIIKPKNVHPIEETSLALENFLSRKNIGKTVINI